MCARWIGGRWEPGNVLPAGNKGSVQHGGTENHGGPRRPCASTISRGRFALSVDLRGAPCLRVRIFIEIRAGTGAARFPRRRAQVRIGTAGPAVIRSRA
jgi:hypothetical protein